MQWLFFVHMDDNFVILCYYTKINYCNIFHISIKINFLIDVYNKCTNMPSFKISHIYIYIYIYIFSLLLSMTNENTRRPLLIWSEKHHMSNFSCILHWALEEVLHFPQSMQWNNCFTSYYILHFFIFPTILFIHATLWLYEIKLLLLIMHWVCSMNCPSET